MKIKMEYIVLVALIVAVSSYIVLRKTDRSLYELPAIESVKAADISKIDISHAGKSLELVKKRDQWVVGENGYPADGEKVRGLTDSIAGFSVSALISESKNYPRYDLDADNRISVKAWIGDKLCRDLYLGKTASSYRHTFVMIAGNPRVYHAGGSLRNSFDLQLDDLRDKAVFAVQIDKINEMTLARNDKTVTLTRETVIPKAEGDTADAVEKTDSKTTTWKTGDGNAGSKKTIDTLLSALKDLNCDRFIENQPKEAFTSPAYSVMLAGDKQYVLKIFKRSDKEAGIPAVSSENDYPFILPQWSADKIMKNLDDLVGKES